jgi:hypothetical protein
MYGTISISTIMLITILIKYLQQKALQKQQVRDKALIDLAFLTGFMTSFSSFLMVIREIIGPFLSVHFVGALFVFYQFLYAVLLSSIVSLQLVQVLSVFFAGMMSEWQEDMIVLCHRMFCLVIGTSSCGLICYFNGGMCRPTGILKLCAL